MLEELPEWEHAAGDGLCMFVEGVHVGRFRQVLEHRKYPGRRGMSLMFTSQKREA